MEQDWQDVYFIICDLDPAAMVMRYSNPPKGKRCYYLQTAATITGDFPNHRLRIGTGSPRQAVMAWWDAVNNSKTSYLLYKGEAWKWIDGKWTEVDQAWIDWADRSRGAKIGTIYEMLEEDRWANEYPQALAAYFDEEHLDRLCSTPISGFPVPRPPTRYMAVARAIGRLFK